MQIQARWEDKTKKTLSFTSTFEFSPSVKTLSASPKFNFYQIRFLYLPIDFLKACVSASVLDISSEKISEPASIVNGVSSPKLLAIPMAMAVLPVPG